MFGSDKSEGEFGSLRQTHLPFAVGIYTSQKAIRKELRQKMMLFPFIQSASVREKRLIAAWKGYVAEPLNSELP